MHSARCATDFPRSAFRSCAWRRRFPRSSVGTIRSSAARSAGSIRFCRTTRHDRRAGRAEDQRCVLIPPGRRPFSLTGLVGRASVANGYRTGMVIANAQTGEAIGGGMCQFSNLIHWMVLHAPLTITEQHHHDQFDLFPDFGRQVPFGTGTSIFYNYLDYRFRNDTEQTYQLLVHTTPTHLCGELRTDAPLAVKYHIAAENERFVREDGVVYRCGEVYRTMVDKTTGNVLSRELLRRNHARVLYDTAGLEIMDR
ncbi:MAG: VanW family protein [Oscillospiraceae bacterium]